MRRAAFLLVALLAAPLPASASPGGWTTVVEDARGDVHPQDPLLPVQDPRADLVEVAMRESGDLLRVRLRTAGNGSAFPLPEGRYESVLSFLVERRLSASVPVEIHASGEGFRLVVSGETLEGALEVGEGAAPWGYEVAFSRWLLLRGASGEEGRVTTASATMRATTFDGRAAEDAAHEARDFPLDARAPLRIEPAWALVEGHDFAAGPSVAVGPDGAVHLAYVVYNDERGAKMGLHHAVLRDGRLRAERIAEASMPTRLHEDRNTQTALAVDEAGVVHVLFEPAPNRPSPAGARYATDAAGGWAVEDPARLADGTRVPVEDGVRASPALAVGKGRVVAALQRADAEAVSLVERGPEGWRLLHTIPQARLARVAIGPEGEVHAAWLRPTSDQSPRRAVYGDLLHASEAAGWRETPIAHEVEDRSKFWKSSEADGSFAFALDRAGAPHFVYESDRGERGFVVLRGGGLERSPTPLRPDHGNIQVRMRMAIDAEGNAHVVTGYGGSDLYAVRSPEGTWRVQPLDRYDVFSLALTPDGRAIVVHTQPHGGTTLALAHQLGGFLVPAGAPGEEGLEARSRLPVPGAGLAGAVAAFALAGPLLRRRDAR